MVVAKSDTSIDTSFLFDSYICMGSLWVRLGCVVFLAIMTSTGTLGSITWTQGEGI